MVSIQFCTHAINYSSRAYKCHSRSLQGQSCFHAILKSNIDSNCKQINLFNKTAAKTLFQWPHNTNPCPQSRYPILLNNPTYLQPVIILQKPKVFLFFTETRPQWSCSFQPCFTNRNLPPLVLIFYILQLGQFSTTL